MLFCKTLSFSANFKSLLKMRQGAKDKGQVKVKIHFAIFLFNPSILQHFKNSLPEIPVCAFFAVFYFKANFKKLVAYFIGCSKIFISPGLSSKIKQQFH